MSRPRNPERILRVARMIREVVRGTPLKAVARKEKVSARLIRREFQRLYALI